ncbi:MAG: ABC transporter permease [Planctomycetota bacterium]|jgi:ribose transport system permease protein|nr:ABC transporter permease [Planctomycetota bacterium]
MSTLRSLLARKWLWSYLGAVAVFIIIAAVSNNPWSTLSASISFATFYILVGIGQMLVITTGPGNIDLSIPNTIAFSASLGFTLMAADNANIPYGALAGVAGGAVIGVFNYALIRFILMPPMIATLASSLVIRSLSIIYFRGMQVKPPAGLEWFVNYRLAGLAPVVFVLALAIALAMQTAITRTQYGRYIHAIGQNLKAAWLCGVNVKRYKLITYALSGVFAGFTGILLAAFTGGATLSMGDEYMLNSIAVVVMGGSSIAGGDSNVIGIVGASVLLYLIVNLLNILGMEAGLRYIFTGVVIIAIIFLSGEKIRRR